MGGRGRNRVRKVQEGDDINERGMEEVWRSRRGGGGEVEVEDKKSGGKGERRKQTSNPRISYGQQ